MADIWAGVADDASLIKLFQDKFKKTDYQVVAVFKVRCLSLRYQVHNVSPAKLLSTCMMAV